MGLMTGSEIFGSILLLFVLLGFLIAAVFAITHIRKTSRTVKKLRAAKTRAAKSSPWTLDMLYLQAQTEAEGRSNSHLFSSYLAPPESLDDIR